MKKTIFLLSAVATLVLGSCVTDDGNYSYRDLPEITVEGIPATMEFLSNIDTMHLRPVITSSTDGQISPTDDNYEVTYKIGYKGMGALGGVDSVAQKVLPWVDLKPTNGFDLDLPVKYTSGTYILWMQIANKRLNTVTDKTFDILINGTTSDGWLVLCNEGADERVRLDMVSQLTSTRIEAMHDIAAGMPMLHHATNIGFVAQMSTPGDVFSIFSREGAYELDQETMESGEEYNFKNIEFAIDPGTNIIREQPFPCSTYSWQCKYRFCFDDEGNAYLNDQTSGGSAYGLPLNTLDAGKPAEFKVAPMCAYSWARPWPRVSAHVLFYDTTNSRFVVFEGLASGWDNAIAQMSPITEGNGTLFDYTTGKKFVYMEGTRRSTGLSYTILQDADGHRSIYGINLGGSQIVQELYIDRVDAPDFDKAEHFAFDTRFPLLFYSVGKKLYMYNMGTKAAHELTTGLKDTESITLLKFNLFRNSSYAALVNQSEAYMNKQYQLIVGSYDTAASGDNNGRLTLFNVDGSKETITEAEQYDGFAKIVDVVYRERAQ